MSHLLPGDVALARSNDLIGWAIRLGTRSRYNHARLITDGLGETVESLAHERPAEGRGQEGQRPVYDRRAHPLWPAEGVDVFPPPRANLWRPR